MMRDLCALAILVLSGCCDWSSLDEPIYHCHYEVKYRVHEEWRYGDVFAYTDNGMINVDGVWYKQSDLEIVRLRP